MPPVARWGRGRVLEWQRVAISPRSAGRYCPGHARHLPQARPRPDPGHHRRRRHQAVTRVLDHAGYEAALRTKLLEEAHEGKLASELADVLEALQALAAAHGMGWEEVVSEASRKRAERGGFDPPG